LRQALGVITLIAHYTNAPVTILASKPVGRHFTLQIIPPYYPENAIDTHFRDQRRR